jgi:hypothetical protein
MRRLINIRKSWEAAGSPAIVNSTVGKIVDLTNKVYSIKGGNCLVSIFDHIQVSTDSFIKARKKDAKELVENQESKEMQIQVCDLLLSLTIGERWSAVALFHGWINRAGQEQPGH